MQSRWSPPLTLAALVVAGLPAAAWAADDERAETPLASTPAEPSPWAGLLSDWAPPQLKLSGWISYNFNTLRGPDGEAMTAQLATASLTGKTFLVQPWLATLEGNLRLSGNWTRVSEPDTLRFGPAPDLHSRDLVASGRAQLDVFPRSRFPLQLHLERTDSRHDTNLAPGFDYRIDALRIVQRYRPEGDAYSVMGRYDRRVQAGSGFRDVQDSLEGEYATQWKHNALSVGANFSQVRRQLAGDRTRYLSLVGRHQYVPDDSLSVNTTVNATRTQETYAAAPSDLTALQLASHGYWRKAGAPLALTASIRGLALRESMSDLSVNGLAASLGATYQLDPRVQLTGTGSVALNSNNGHDTQHFGGSAGANWNAPSVEVLGMQYERFASASVGANVSLGAPEGTETMTNAGLQAGHSLHLTKRLSANSVAIVTGTQTLTGSYSHTNSALQPAGGPQRTLLTSASAAWNSVQGSKSAFARIGWSDSRELGTEARFQLWNFQLSGTWEIDRWQSITGELTLQRSVRHDEPGVTPNIYELGGSGVARTRGGSGEISYQHQRFFGVPGLRFTSRFRLAQDVLSQAGMLPNLLDRETRMWENRLDWSVGRLETGLLYRLSEVDEKARHLLMFRVQRSFGD
jgi:hypothetical protein